MKTLGLVVFLGFLTLAAATVQEIRAGPFLIGAWNIQVGLLNCVQLVTAKAYAILVTH